MTRNLFPSEAHRHVQRVGAAGTAITSGAGAVVTVYSDVAGTVLAAITTPAGAAIQGSVLVADATGRLPDFLGPDDSSIQLYARVDGGAPQPMEADTGTLLDRLTALENDLDARIQALEGGTTTPQNTAPAAPDTFTATASGLVTAANWSAAVDDSGVIDHYVLQRKLPGEADFTQVLTTDGNTLTATDAVPAGTANGQYQVYAVDADQGNGGVAGPVQVTFTAAPASYDTVAPTVPTGLGVAVDSTVPKLTSTWNASTDQAAAGQTLAGLKRYIVERSLTSATANDFAPVGYVLAGATRTYADTDLGYATQAWYRVRAQDNNLNISGPSLVQNATTITQPSTPTGISPKAVGDTQVRTLGGVSKTWKCVTSRDLTVFDTNLFFKENSSAATNSAINPTDRSNSEMQKPKVPGLVQVVNDPTASGGKCFSALTAKTDYDVTGGTAHGWGNGRWGSHENVTAPCRVRTRIKKIGTPGSQCKLAIMFWPNGAWGQNWEMDFAETFGGPGWDTKYSQRWHGAYPDGNTAGNQTIHDISMTTNEWHIFDLVMLDTRISISVDGVEQYFEPNAAHPDLRHSPLFKQNGAYYYPHQDGHFCVGRALTGFRSDADLAAHGMHRETDDIRVDWFEYWLPV